MTPGDWAYLSILFFGFGSFLIIGPVHDLVRWLE